MIKAIETNYGGARFRSRLEARYALLFDLLGLPWEYEKEGFDVDGTWYLPDFHISSREWWIEIKGAYPLREQWDMLYKVAEHTKAKRAFIFWGMIKIPDDRGGFCASDLTHCMMVYPYWDNDFLFCQCPECGTVGLQFEGRGARVCGDRCCPSSDRDHNIATPFLVNCFREAAGARFEYDERK